MPRDSDDEEEDEEIGEHESGFGNIVVVDNLPTVEPSKYDKLLGVVKKIFSQIGSVRENGLWLPVDDETKKTKGYAFVEYSSPQVLPYVVSIFQRFVQAGSDKLRSDWSPVMSRAKCGR